MSTRSRLRLVLSVALLVAILPAAPAAAVVEHSTSFESYPDAAPVENNDAIVGEFAASHEVSFPNGVRARKCPPDERCGPGGALDGDVVIQGTADSVNEFGLEPVLMRFTTPQQMVSFSIAAPLAGMLEGIAEARDDDGDVVATQDVSVASGQWQQIDLAAASSDIVEVDVVATFADTNDNVYVIDLLSTSRADGEAGSDTQAPTVNFFTHDNRTVGDARLNVIVQVSDNQRIATVDGATTPPTGGGQGFGNGNLCGPDRSPCSSAQTFSQTYEVRFANGPGEYVISVRACDLFSNCAQNSITVTYDPPSIEEIAVEVNQAVAGFPSMNRSTPGQDVLDVSAGAPLIPRRDTLVRLYVGAHSGVLPEAFNEPLRVSLLDEDGTTSTLTVPMSTTGQTGIALQEVAADESDWRETVQRQRPDLTTTANYVITKHDIPIRTQSMVINNRWRFTMAESGEIAMTIVLPTGVTASATRADYYEKVKPFYERVMPVNRVVEFNFVEPHWGGPWPGHGDKTECEALLESMWWGFGSSTIGVTGATTNPQAAIVSEVRGCGGIAYLGSPDSQASRVGGDSVSETEGRILAQETMHNLGLIHAGDDHGESRGGDTEPWPNPHGSISPDGVSTMGVIMVQTGGLGDPNDFPAPDPADREWDVALVDPCTDPTVSHEERIDPVTPCGWIPGSNDPFRHDYMSYGGDATALPLLADDQRGWTSLTTYRRAHNAIVNHTINPGNNTLVGFQQATDETVEAMLVGGELLADGTGSMSPIITKSVWSGLLSPAATPEDPNDGHGHAHISVRLLDSSGGQLGEAVRADVSSTHDTNLSFRAMLPAHPDAVTIEVLNDGAVLASRTRSGVAPSVSLDATPTFAQDGTVSFGWEASDSDGDLQGTIADYSIDGGRTWQAFAILPAGAETTGQFDLSELEPTGDVIVRVLASDGFSTAEDRMVVQSSGPPRITGSGAGGTAIAVCQELAADDAARAILLARDDVFADALAGAPLAGDDACVLVTPGGPDEPLDADVRTEIDRALPEGGQVYVLGGARAVSAAAATELADAGYNVQRFEGSNRFATSALIAAEVRANNPGTEVIVAYGGNWPDAVTAGAYGGSTGTPILLSETESVPAETAAALTDMGSETSIVAGGTAVISDPVMAQLPSARRVFGTTRVGTAAEVATQLWGAGAPPTTALVVNLRQDDGWILALAAAPLSASRGAPQLGVENAMLPQETIDYLQAGAISSVTVIGDTGYVRSEEAAQIQQILDGG